MGALARSARTACGGCRARTLLRFERHTDTETDVRVALDLPLHERIIEKPVANELDSSSERMHSSFDLRASVDIDVVLIGFPLDRKRTQGRAILCV